jgi:Retrotransposon gag protein/Zinc knuckle
MPPRVETIKLPLPDAYDGARGKADTFVEKMETYFRFTQPNLPEKDKISLAAFLLEGAARSWFKGAPDDAFPSWESFADQLKKRFALHNAVNTFSDALYSLRQQRMPISLHDQNFENLVLELETAGLKLSEDEAFQRYRHSLNDYYKDKLAEHPHIKTYREAFEKLEALPSPYANILESSIDPNSQNVPPGMGRRLRRGPGGRGPMNIPRTMGYDPTARLVPRREPIKPFTIWKANGRPRFGASLHRWPPKPGEPVPDVPKPPQNLGHAGTSMANVKCFRCQRTGHYAKSCPMLNDGARQ